MREIKFRGKRKSNGEWVFGYYIGEVSTENHTIVYADYENYYCQDEVDPATVGQYTGLKDKKGAEIYEGDILSRKDWGMGGNHDDEEWYEVQQLDYYLDQGEEWGHFRVHLWNEYCEVAGNVYDNPDLLES